MQNRMCLWTKVHQRMLTISIIYPKSIILSIQITNSSSHRKNAISIPCKTSNLKMLRIQIKEMMLVCRRKFRVVLKAWCPTLSAPSSMPVQMCQNRRQTLTNLPRKHTWILPLAMTCTNHLWIRRRAWGVQQQDLQVLLAADKWSKIGCNRSVIYQAWLPIKFQIWCRKVLDWTASPLGHPRNSYLRELPKLLVKLPPIKEDQRKRLLLKLQKKRFRRIWIWLCRMKLWRKCWGLGVNLPPQSKLSRENC